MGKTQSYVRGGGSHTNVPIPLNQKVELYRTSKKIISGPKLNSDTTLAPTGVNFDTRGRRRIEWDL